MEVTIENESKLSKSSFLPSRKAKDEIERTIGTKEDLQDAQARRRRKTRSLALSDKWRRSLTRSPMKTAIRSSSRMLEASSSIRRKISILQTGVKSYRIKETEEINAGEAKQAPVFNTYNPP